MKKILLLLAVASLASFLIVGSASASTYTFTQAELLAMTETSDNPSGIGALASKTAVPSSNAVEFAGHILDSNTQFRQIQIGFDFVWPTSPPQMNLTGYTEYSLSFYNNNDDDWYVNLYINTGWTDPGVEENAVYIQNGWTEIAQGESVTLSIDLTGSTTYESWTGIWSGSSYSWGNYLAADTPSNLGRVTNIGFNIATDKDSPSPMGYDYPGDDFHMQVGAVPIPGAIWLFGTGLMGLVGMRRKFQK